MSSCFSPRRGAALGFRWVWSTNIRKLAQQRQEEVLANESLRVGQKYRSPCPGKTLQGLETPCPGYGQRREPRRTFRALCQCLCLVAIRAKKVGNRLSTESLRLVIAYGRNPLCIRLYKIAFARE